MRPPDRIVLAHGGGGVLTRRLIDEVWRAAFDDPALERLPDGAVLEAVRAPDEGRIAFTTDSYVVKPLFFRGGGIGRLAVCGTVNDLAVTGARPHYISLAAIIEEGFAVDDLRRVADSAAEAAREAGVRIVTGDTKVVETGAADGLFLTTAGVGFVPEGREVGPHLACEGDAVILSGTIGDHGIALMAEREGLAFETPVSSDCAPLGGLVGSIYGSGAEPRAMRDPTRGGLAAALYEIAEASGVTVELEEAAVPVRPEVRGACEMLGLDPLTVANEGKLVAILPAADAERALEAARAHPLGKDAALVGRVVAKRERPLILKTRIGGERIVEMPYGEELPRIC
ncbi:MAG: hydrogenase expression/formation protein HypE [Planctomycetota bacterium]|jgi:hydrogenase expression/formation protein HypE